ncbi:hypothetical protein [Sphingomonas sp. M1-B02]|uniref:hypothetical protein n=1 Tax=Sphingomonas sp. M1-B02 TaxID=3114300 RepID=UPI00223E9E64|nr:hypothetical protein [Sphingomonas sp. S6-11]UZK67860.1 site-specific integrase [Sphingomonas sp. S6-11]
MKSESALRVQLGPYWLWYRRDRDDWQICWLDRRAVRRRSTGIKGAGVTPPREAQAALGKHFLENQRPETGFQDPSELTIEEITRLWRRDHVAYLKAPERYDPSIATLARFFEREQARGTLRGAPTIADIRTGLVRAFIRFREQEGASPPTIARDLAALRGPVMWARNENMVASVPKVIVPEGSNRSREDVYTPEQIAALLERAAALPERRHLLLYMVISLSTLARSQAILELVAETQIKGDRIYFNAPGRQQTRKRRAVVPIAPTLRPWLEGITGKVIVYRAVIFEAARVCGGPDHFHHPTADVGRAFKSCLIEAGLKQPALDLCRPVLDEHGVPITLPPRLKLRENKPRPLMQGVGTPNTLRHSLHTFLASKGVPSAQVKTAAGHTTEDGCGDRYNHLRPEYLMEFVAGIEAFWSEVGRFTSVHLRYQSDTKGLVQHPGP